jgi:hypothetical protein
VHTATQLHSNMFNLKILNVVRPPQSLLQWSSHDRLGVVMTEPFGALGAMLLIQLAIANYFEVENKGRRQRPNYAEAYLFHVGGRWGDFSSFDFWPARREIFLAADSCVVLASLNSHGITHLLVPDGEPNDIVHHYKEPEAAIDRVKCCFAYSADGRVADGDVELSSGNAAALENLQTTLEPERLLNVIREPGDAVKMADRQRWQENVRSRLHEVPKSARQLIDSRARAIIAAGFVAEQYRRVSVEWALQRLTDDRGG